MTYTLPTLPYAYNAIEPNIDGQTMEIHHTKHHAAYVTNLNKALESAKIEAPECVYALLADLSKVPESIRTAVRNNGGGHANHSFFWKLIAPQGPAAPVGKSAEAITATFGSLDSLKEKFATAALSRFGSGWAWLVLKKDLTLAVISTPNQDHPCMQEVECRGWPIIGLDLWEHAYYLKYQNRRADYITAFWNAINWRAVEHQYEMAHDYFSGKHGTCSSSSCSL